MGAASGICRLFGQIRHAEPLSLLEINFLSLDPYPSHAFTSIPRPKLVISPCHSRTMYAFRPTPPLQRFHIGKWTQLLHTSTPKQSPDMTCHLYSTGTLAILLSLFDNGHRQGKKSGAKSEPTLKIMNVSEMSDTKLGRTRYTCRLVVK